MQSNNQIPTRGLPGGRKRTHVDNYFADTDGLPPSEVEHLALESANDHVSRYFTTLAENETAMTDISDDPHPDSIGISIDRKLDALTGWAKYAGFQSLLEAAQSEAKARRTTTREWIASGGLSDLLQSSQKAIPLRRTSNATDEANRNGLLSAICAPARDIYVTEWRRLLRDSFFKIKLSSFTPDKIMSFSFAAIYEKMQSNAPCLIDLCQTLAAANPWTTKDSRTPTHSQEPVAAPDSDTSDDEDNNLDPGERNRRVTMRIVVALCVLANTCTHHFNILQGMVAYVLYGYRVPRRALSILNRLGISSSYNNLRTGLKSNGKALLAELRKVAAKGKAFWISCDNCTYSGDVKNERMHHQRTFRTETVAYLVEPANSEPYFVPGDVNYNGLKDISLDDYIPTDEDNEHLENMIQCLIWETIGRFAAGYKKKLGRLEFRMPEINPLKRDNPPKIRVMRTYALDEGKISDMISILEKMARDVGMTEKQVEEIIVAFKGDFATVRNQRFRRRRAKRGKRLNFVEATAGLFHLQVQALVMFFQAHMGTDADVFSLERWIREIRRDKQKIWNRQKEIVREFRQSQSFFDIVLDGNIVAAVANACGFGDSKAFVADIETLDPEQLKKSIENLAKMICNFVGVSQLRLSGESDRDSAYEKHWMFLQHGLVLRSLARGMRDGDSGRVLVSLSYLTIWFQASDKFNYAYETLHLMTCIKRLWSPRMKKFWMENCLINLSGKAGAWMACDQLCEHVVKEVKDMMHHNVDEKTGDFLRNTLSPQIMSFYFAKQKMRTETGAMYDSSHSSETPTCHEVYVIADRILEGKVCQLRRDRESNAKESTTQDLHADGLRDLAGFTRINKYVAKMERDVGLNFPDDLEGEWADEDDEVVAVAEETVEEPMGEDEYTWLEV